MCKGEEGGDVIRLHIYINKKKKRVKVRRGRKIGS